MVKALDLDHGTLKGRTARRLFAGKPVSEHSRAELFAALGKTTVKLGFVSEPTALEQYDLPIPMHHIVGKAFAETAKRWDALLALMQSHSAPIQDHSIAVHGFLRLVIIDLALRLFAFVRLANLDPPDAITPAWTEDNSQRKLLRTLAKDAGLTREELADRLKTSDTSVDNWLDGKVRPTRKNVATLAEVLTQDSPNPNAHRIEGDIQRHFALAHLADLIVPVIGRKRVKELGTALYRFVRLITENVEGMQRPPIEENPTAKVAALVCGTAHPSTIPLLEDLASDESDPAWEKYIMAATVSWDVAFQRIAIEAGSPGMAAGLAQDFSDVLPTDSNRPEDAQRSDPSEEIRERMMQGSSLDDITHMIHGGTCAMARIWQDNLKLRYTLIRDFPTSSEAHFNLGSFLGMVGKHMRSRDLIDEGTNECKIAALLLHRQSKQESYSRISKHTKRHFRNSTGRNRYCQRRLLTSNTASVTR
ncbi:MAG: hypothetical protein M2R45_05485 [Verrucomicrobia subdivision 3 bacterium]|nr:hypothetical protein [Limisphaerales bacterium]